MINDPSPYIPPQIPVEMVNHPRHYNEHPSGVECIDVIRWLTPCVSNAVKYVWRAPYKGNERQDLEKAEFYLKDAIAYAQPPFVLGGYHHAAPLLDQVARAETDFIRVRFFVAILHADLTTALDMVQFMLEGVDCGRGHGKDVG